MAAKESICIDYAGRKINKILPQSIEPIKLIRGLFEINNLEITNETKKTGYTVFRCKSLLTGKFLVFNIFFSNFKFDIQRPNFININLGTSIQNPYELALDDSEEIITLIIGIYVFDEKDSAEEAIYVSCPIKDRDYTKNPSLRPRIDLIQEARLNSHAIFENDAGDEFNAFKPMNFTEVYDLHNLGVISFHDKNKDHTSDIKIFNTRRPGPKPSSRDYIVRKNNIGSPCVYLAGWGKTNIWKIGRTKDINRRIKEFNQYIPFEEDPLLDIWTLHVTRELINEETAHEIEDKILNDKHLAEFRTVGERFKCDLNIIKSVFDNHTFVKI